MPPGSQIWNNSEAWINEKEWHPAGVISNVDGGQVEWADVSFMSIDKLLMLTGVAYPVFSVAILLILTVLVSMCLTPEDSSDGDSHLARERRPSRGQAASSSSVPSTVVKIGADPMYDPPVLPKDQLSSSSRVIYACWTLFCRLIPAWMVFGLPALMLGLARPYPQEVFGVLTLLTSAFLFANSIYMAIFAVSATLRMRRASALSGGSGGTGSLGPLTEEIRSVTHWVILPQYKEDLEVVSMTLRSIAASPLARSSICVLLGMEEREGEAAHRKAAELCTRFKLHFREMQVTYHPANLPNDPPGKASNLSWAFRQLTQHASSSAGSRGDGASAEEVLANIVLTVADADSEFSAGYFEHLARSFLQAGAQREIRIWQSPVFHMKNYHRQPSPVFVGTMFTCMNELAALADPNAVRFPYSTYSLSMSLARRVGGWDPDWIAEDYHMGIKCFLLTLGQTSVEPILLPTVNYTPEDEDCTWLGTIMARWAQAKRHALGFSDMSYYFMMLPLIFSYAATHEDSMHGLQAFWSMATFGVTLLIRLVNVHVVIGILCTYTLLASIVRMMMLVFFSSDRNIAFLFNRTQFCPQLLMSSGVVCSVLVSGLFVTVYHFMHIRIEGKPEPAFRHPFMHFARNALAILVFGPVYFYGLGYCVWEAAVRVLVSQSFEYEVAPKPTICLGSGGAGGGAPDGAETKTTKVDGGADFSATLPLEAAIAHPPRAS